MLFVSFLRAEPVLLVDMPGDGATEMVKEILNECTERMQEVSLRWPQHRGGATQMAAVRFSMRM